MVRGILHSGLGNVGEPIVRDACEAHIPWDHSRACSGARLQEHIVTEFLGMLYCDF